MSAASRQALRRNRARAGVSVLAVEIDAEMLATALDAAHRLPIENSESRAALAAAVRRIIEDWSGVDAYAALIFLAIAGDKRAVALLAGGSA